MSWQSLQWGLSSSAMRLYVKSCHPDLDHIEEWAKDNDLVLNRSKSAELVVRINKASALCCWTVLMGMTLNCNHILFSLVAFCTDVSWDRPVNVSSCTVVFIYKFWSYLIQQRYLALIAFLCWCAVKQSINQYWTSCYRVHQSVVAQSARCDNKQSVIVWSTRNKSSDKLRTNAVRSANNSSTRNAIRSYQHCFPSGGWSQAWTMRDQLGLATQPQLITLESRASYKVSGDAWISVSQLSNVRSRHFVCGRPSTRESFHGK